MNDRFKKAGLFVCFICILLGSSVISTLGAEQTSIIDRLQKVEDPELEELIRFAVTNTPEAKRADEQFRGLTGDGGGDPRGSYRNQMWKAAKVGVQIARRVTEEYAQIRLMDTQIEQIAVKIKASQKEILSELILAKAELEAKRMTKLAELREIMNIVPKHAFGHQSERDLKNWLALDVRGDMVHIFRYRKPFIGRDYLPSSTDVVTVTSTEKAAKYIQDLMKKRKDFPLRITIFRTESGIKVSEQLYAQIIEIIKNAKAQFEADVYLMKVRNGLSEEHYFLHEGQIYDKWDPDGQDHHRWRGDFSEEFVEKRLTTPGSLPRKYNIEHDAASKDLAARMIDTIKAKTKELKLERYVEIEQQETSSSKP